MMLRLIPATAIALAIGGAAYADAFTNSVVRNLRSLGYDYIEIKRGPTQLKAEGVRGTRKIEVVYDRRTGKILKQEFERAERDEVGLAGVEIDRRSRDFLDDDDGRDRRRASADDDDDDSGRGRGRGRGRGGDDRDDDDDDDDRSGRGGGDRDDDDDDDKDDRSGRGGGDRDDDDDDDRSGRGGGDRDRDDRSDRKRDRDDD